MHLHTKCYLGIQDKYQKLKPIRIMFNLRKMQHRSICVCIICICKAHFRMHQWKKVIDLNTTYL